MQPFLLYTNGNKANRLLLGGVNFMKLVISNESETRQAIALRGYSIRGFSKEIAMSHSYLSQVLSGIRNPSPTIANKIANGLDQKIGDIFFIRSGSFASKEVN